MTVMLKYGSLVSCYCCHDMFSWCKKAPYFKPVCDTCQKEFIGVISRRYEEFKKNGEKVGWMVRLMFNEIDNIAYHMFLDNIWSKKQKSDILERRKQLSN